MKPNTTEEIILVPCLLVGWAIATIACDVVAPLAALMLTLLGWRPAKCGAPLPKAVDTFKACAQHSPLPAPMPPRTFSSRDVLQALSSPQLRSVARLRGINFVGLSRKELIEALLDDAVDRDNDYSAEVPTAAERSPSLRRGRP